MSTPDVDVRVHKYQQIREELRREIEEGVYGPGRKLPTDAELSVRFETSRLTIIRALQDLQVEGLVERKAGSGTFVRKPSEQVSKVFGLLVANNDQGDIFQ